MIKIIIPKDLWKMTAGYALLMSVLKTFFHYFHYHIQIGSTSIDPILEQTHHYDVIVFAAFYFLSANILNYFKAWKD